MKEDRETDWKTLETRRIEQVGIAFIDLVKEREDKDSATLTVHKLGADRYQVGFKDPNRDCVVFEVPEQSAKRGEIIVQGYRTGLEGDLSGSLIRLDEALRQL